MPRLRTSSPEWATPQGEVGRPDGHHAVPAPGAPQQLPHRLRRGETRRAVPAEDATRWSMIEVADEIYRSNRTFMFGVAFNHVHNRDDAEDIVQNASIRLIQQRTTPEPKDRRGLAYTLADHSAHEFMDATRAKCRDVRQTDRLDLSNTAHHPLAQSAEDAVILQETIKQRLQEQDRKWGLPEPARTCTAPYCNQPIPSGGRSDQKYCSQACRSRVYRARKVL